MKPGDCRSGKTISIKNGADHRKQALILSVIRPDSYYDVAKAHFPFVLVCGLVLMLSNLVPLEILPTRACLFLWITGYPCVFCGFTRSIWALPQGDWEFAFLNCPLACLLYGVILCVFAWNFAGLLCGVIISRGRLLSFKPGRARLIMITIGGLILLNWVYRILSGLK